MAITVERIGKAYLKYTGTTTVLSFEDDRTHDDHLHDLSFKSFLYLYNL